MSDIAHSISKLCDTVNDLRNQLDEQGRIADARKVVIAQRDARIAALEAENERLRKVLETTPPATHVAVPSVDDIAEVLFSQRGTPYRWERAIDADPLSDEGTLVSIVLADAQAVLALFDALEAENRERSEYLVGVIEERERLRRALEPFAKVYEKDISVHDDDADLFQPMTTHNRAPRLTAGDFRRAYEAHQEELKP